MHVRQLSRSLGRRCRQGQAPWPVPGHLDIEPEPQCVAHVLRPVEVGRHGRKIVVIEQGRSLGQPQKLSCCHILERLQSGLQDRSGLGVQEEVLEQLTLLVKSP